MSNLWVIHDSITNRRTSTIDRIDTKISQNGSCASSVKVQQSCLQYPFCPECQFGLCGRLTSSFFPTVSGSWSSANITSDDLARRTLALSLHLMLVPEVNKLLRQ